MLEIIMKKIFQKIKKISIYGFAIIGFLALIGLLGSSILVGLNSAKRSSAPIDSSESSGVFEAPLAVESPLDSLNFLELLPGLKSTTSERSGKIFPSVQAGEGQLTKRKIVRNGALSLLVKKAEEAVRNIQALANNLGGFISESRVYETSGGSKSGTIILRIPADRFDEAIAEIKKLAVKVENETTSAQDVTEKFVDLEAQLKSAQAQETQYLEILKRAVTVEEVLKVQQKLGETRSTIEKIQGQIQFLSRQVEMSTISVSLTSEADITVFGIRWRPLFVLKQSFRNMLKGLSGYIDAMIVFIFFLPRLILWLATIAFFSIIGWRIFRWIWRKFIKSSQLPNK
ncbi:MAG: hypothetical protein COV69_04595 [Parcubacteria group bacterium CG11_big_fil_rev_8_21_14_0_20_39_14]|nr:MAG: hypothetical protein COV69_04595 [Parcubacteria group bacterium CG11_big_fil_rev_8_21_14_0_20_39_14]